MRAKLGAFVALLGFAWALHGCMPAKAPDVDPCSAELVRLEGMRDAEVLAACQGHTLDECPTVRGIDLKYDPLIRAQIECAQ